MLKRLHPIAGIVAFLTILTFWTSTIVAEAFFPLTIVAAVKHAIPWGLLLLIPALAITGASGFRLGRGSRDPRIAAKRRRMPIIAGNGVLVLIPCALILSALATRGAFGGLFYAIQAVEIVAGSVNLTLMALNIRDGLQAAGRVRQPKLA